MTLHSLEQDPVEGVRKFSHRRTILCRLQGYSPER